MDVLLCMEDNNRALFGLAVMLICFGAGGAFALAVEWVLLRINMDKRLKLIYRIRGGKFW